MGVSYSPLTIPGTITSPNPLFLLRSLPSGAGKMVDNHASLAVSCRSSGHGWFLQPFEAKLWKKGPTRRKYQIKNRSKTKHKGKNREKWTKVKFTTMKIWWLLSAENRRESFVLHFRWFIWFLSCSGWTSYFKSFTNLQYSDISGRIAKKRPVLNQMLDQQTFYKDLKMVNQMIPRTISTPTSKNFLDQACLDLLIKFLHFEWITFVESQINEGPSELTLGMSFLQKSLYWIL